MTNMTLDDAADGDMVIIAGREYRITGRIGADYLCREGRNGPLHTFREWQPIESISFVQPVRPSKGRKGKQDDLDPLQQDNPDNGLLWRGTVK